MKLEAGEGGPENSRRSPQGERGLKSGGPHAVDQDEPRRSPQGERGLKSEAVHIFVGGNPVALRKESVD